MLSVAERDMDGKGVVIWLLRSRDMISYAERDMDGRAVVIWLLWSRDMLGVAEREEKVAWCIQATPHYIFFNPKQWL